MNHTQQLVPRAVTPRFTVGFYALRVQASSQIDGNVYFYLYCSLNFVSLCLGFIGNIFIVCVMLTERLRRRSYSRFFFCLALSDTVILAYQLCIFLNVVSYYFFGIGIIPLNGYISCCFYEYTVTTCTFSPYVLVIISTERLSVIHFPFTAKRFWTLKHNSVWMIGLLFVICSLYSFVWWEIAYVRDMGCIFTSPIVYSYYMSIGPAITAFIPTFILMLTTSAIIISLRTNKIKTLKSSSASKQATVMILATSIFFLITICPLCTIAVLMTLHSGDSFNESFNVPYKIASTLFSLNYSANFYIYLLTGKEVRDSAKQLICCTKSR
ncbi:uncharacterized protein LOC141909191 [Tubulanus polymorphus]|uniref:uncharacterized protein LOC141909191 n=1 Tax=Tubulanus polymorphus TaxID=672921 RepID=UPI003DA5FE87